MFYEQVEGPESDGLRDLWFRKPKGYIIHRIRMVERDVSYVETPFSESAEHWYVRTYCYLTGTFNKDWIEWKTFRKNSERLIFAKDASPRYLKKNRPF